MEYRLEYGLFYFYLDLRLILDPAAQSDYSSHIGQRASLYRSHIRTPHVYVQYGGHTVRD